MQGVVAAADAALRQMGVSSALPPQAALDERAKLAAEPEITFGKDD